ASPQIFIHLSSVLCKNHAEILEVIKKSATQKKSRNSGLVSFRDYSNWYRRNLEQDKNIRIIQFSDPYTNKGTKKFVRVYAEIEKKVK
ncbi:MAG: hypothetical protein ACRC3H_21660, partial [Lachnospiraceae bacterium]